MSNRIDTSLLIALLSLVFPWSSVAQGYRSMPPSLERDVLQYLDSSDTLPNDDLRRRIHAREKDLKPMLAKMLEDAIIKDPSIDYSKITMMADLSSGLKDKAFDLKIWRNAMLKFQQWPAILSPIFFDNYLRHDPEGAVETFQKLVGTGNENVRKYAQDYLDKIAEGRVPADHRPPDRPNSEEPARGNPALEPEGDSNAGGFFWLLVALCGVSVLGIVFVLFRSRSHR